MLVLIKGIVEYQLPCAVCNMLDQSLSLGVQNMLKPLFVSFLLLPDL